MPVKKHPLKQNRKSDGSNGSTDINVIRDAKAKLDVHHIPLLNAYTNRVLSNMPSHNSLKQVSNRQLRVAKKYMMPIMK